MTERLTKEQLAKLPYQQTPATVEDVVKEMRRHSMLLTAMITSSNPDFVAKKLEADEPSEMKTIIVVQETRLALALESWLSEEIKVAMTLMGDATIETIDRYDKLRFPEEYR